jgi:pimeloyl-ACP methyl ester carboxylesterase
MIVTTPSSEIYYEVHGDGPPLVMLHGGLVDIRSWKEQLVLAEDLELVLPDTRRFGRSSGSLDGLTVEGLADDVLAVTKDAGVDSFYLLGFSMGGFIAQTLAVLHPELVRGLILVSTRSGRFTPGHSSTGLAEVQAHVERAYSDGYPEAHPEFIKGYVAMALENDAKGWAGVRAVCGEAPGLDEVTAIRCPTLVLHARADKSVPLADAQKLADAIPNARIEVLDGTGHTMQVERPETFNALVRDFVLATEKERA